jgi:hypothetical protein
MILAHNQDFKGVQSQGTDFHLDWRLVLHSGQQAQMAGNIRRRIALKVSGRQPAKMPAQQGRVQIATMMTNGLEKVYHLLAPTARNPKSEIPRTKRAVIGFLAFGSWVYLQKTSYCGRNGQMFQGRQSHPKFEISRTKNRDWFLEFGSWNFYLRLKRPSK